MWRATSHYYAQSFPQAASLYARKDSVVALFNAANAHAQSRDYIRALRDYNALLERQADFPGAKENRDRLEKIVDDINRLSASQQQEAGVSSEEIDEFDPQIGEGSEELTAEQTPRKQYSAEELLASPETAALWLRSVQQNGGRFLRTKFAIQLSERGVSE